MNFEQAFDALIQHEGGYANLANDPGGETRYGITKAVARENGYTGDMRQLPLETAKQIAKVKYWDKVQAEVWPPALRFDLFDCTYHSGPTQAIKLMQRALNVADDGKIGPKTLLAAKMADGVRAVARFNAYRLIFLTDLKNWKDFSKGWARRVANNLLIL